MKLAKVKSMRDKISDKKLYFKVPENNNSKSPEQKKRLSNLLEVPKHEFGL